MAGIITNFFPSQHHFLFVRQTGDIPYYFTTYTSITQYIRYWYLFHSKGDLNCPWTAELLNPLTHKLLNCPDIRVNGWKAIKIMYQKRRKKFSFFRKNVINVFKEGRSLADPTLENYCLLFRTPVKCRRPG